VAAGAVQPASILTTRISPDSTGQPPVVAAYLAADAAALGFFAGTPFDTADRLASAQRAAEFSRQRSAVADVLADQNADWGAPGESMREAVSEGIEALREPGSVAVVTGQQPGLFGGPLFTILKALTAAKLAERLQEESGRRTVPVFWIADEDHDFAEVHEATVVVDGRVLRLAYEDGRPAGENRGAVGRLTLGRGIEQTLGDLETAGLPGLFASDLVAAMREAWRPGARWRDAFARTLRVLLPECPLVLVSSDDIRIKRVAAGLLAAEADDWAATHAAHVDGTRRLEAAGFHVQVEPRPLHLFRLVEGSRMALDPADASDAGAGVLVRATGERITSAAFSADVRAAPESYSPDVVLRPVMQDTLLPTACYVAGPGEIAYFAQMAGVYRRFGVPMPLIVPRATMTLVEPAIRRALAMLGIDVPGIMHGRERRSTLEREAPEVAGALADVEVSVREAFSRAEAAVVGLDASLDRAAEAARARSLKSLSRLTLKAERVARRRRSDEQARLARVSAALRPNGKLQERAQSALGFYARYGPSLGGLIAQAIDLDERGHIVVDLP
jgi:bacillithiol biosynthesis cysteine-adding enzyme BshC